MSFFTAQGWHKHPVRASSGRDGHALSLDPEHHDGSNAENDRESDHRCWQANRSSNEAEQHCWDPHP
jgi:hypothetical protein